jgi:hypothetical protein
MLPMTALPGAKRRLVVVPRRYDGPVAGEPGLTLDGELVRARRVAVSVAATPD